jgi:hypothetical protein
LYVPIREICDGQVITYACTASLLVVSAEPVQ